MQTVYLISCTKSKQNYTCAAEEMYKPSMLFCAALDFAMNHVEDKLNQIFILSAKYGLLSLSDVIDTYNETLKGKSASERAQWGKCVSESINEKFDVDNTDFILLAGRLYAEPLIKYLRHYETPLKGKRRWERVPWLRENMIQSTNGVDITSKEIISGIPEKRSGIIISAKDLRDKEKLKTIPDDKPGWYRWWAPEKALKQLLDSQYVSKKYLNELKPKMEEKDGLFYIYVGIAVNESIQARLNWHVNQNHTDGHVKHGTLSTLRQTISSLVVGSQYDEFATNELIDMLTIEYGTIDYPIKSNAARKIIEQIEHKEMEANLLPLNIKDNNNPIMRSFKSDLKKARKKSKERVTL